MGRGLAGEGQVVEPGNAERGLVNTVAFEAAVPQDLPVLQPGQGVVEPGAGPAMAGVLCLLPWAEACLTASLAVLDEQAGALVAAIGDGWAPRQARSSPDEVKARQSLRLPGRGMPIATARRLLASMTTCRFVEYR